MTITETSGSNQTNVPFEIGLPIASGTLTASDSIVAVDSDGVTQLLIQEDNRSSDNYSQVRFLKITGVLPTLNASEKRQITIKKLPGTAPATGTDITAADVLATAYDATVTVADRDGNTYTASVRDGLAAGTFTSSTTAATYGKFRTGGGLCTEFIVYVPLKNGATQHAQLFTVASCSFYKTSRGAVSGPNPIIAAQTSFSVENSFAQRSAPTDDWYDATFTSGTSTIAWTGLASTANLTLSATTLHSAPTVTSSIAMFNVNSIGQLISDGTGVLVISKYFSPTSVTGLVFKAFSSSSLSSGTYRCYGIAHPYATRFRTTLWWSGGKNGLWNSDLGVAWNNTTLTGGPFSYINSTAMILNYQAPPTSTSLQNDLAAATNGLNACGTNPFGYISTIADASNTNGGCGPITMRMPNTGGRSEIAPMPGWFVSALIRYDSTAKRAIFGTCDKASTIPIHWRDQTTGLVPTMNSGTDWVWNQNLKLPSATVSINDWNVQTAHMGSYPYLAYIISGDYFWIDELQQTSFFIWAAAATNYPGSQLNKMSCFNDEQRGMGWDFVKVFQSCVVTPDTSTGVLGSLKTTQQTWIENHMTTVNSGTPSGVPAPGALIRYVNNTGTGKTYAVDGPRWLTKGDVGGVAISEWQGGYYTTALYFADGCGMLSPNWKTFRDWFSSFIVTGMVNPNVSPFYLMSSYWLSTKDALGNTWNDWQTLWYKNAPAFTNGNNRYLNQPLPLSTRSGTSIIATFPPGMFSNSVGLSFYANGVVQDFLNFSMTNIPTVNVGGTGYTVGDVLTLTVTTISSTNTIRKPTVTVSAVSGGVVTAVTVLDPGLYQSQSGHYGNTTGDGGLATCTGGTGTGATFNAISLHYGRGYITNITTDGVHDYVTLNATGSISGNFGFNPVLMYPFAVDTLNSGFYYLPWNYGSDTAIDGYYATGSQYAYPVGAGPGSLYAEYSDITQTAMTLYASSGITNAAAALAVANSVYSGGHDVKWWVNGR